MINKIQVCFMMLSVMLAVMIGSSYDISAYGYESPLQVAHMNNEDQMLTGAEPVTANIQEADALAAEEAAEEVEVIIQEEKKKKAAEEAARLAKEEAERKEAAKKEAAKEAARTERDVLSRIVMAEAGSEDIQGQIMVANVILNRVCAGYGSTVSEVVFAPGQFEPVSSGAIWSVSPTASVYEAVDRALAGEDYSGGALYFVSASCNASWFWSSLTFVTQHGGHVFFR